jgi:formylglycine-generating enzyme required for sulfatase activity
VYLPEFHIGRYEITNRQFMVYAQKNDSDFECPAGKDGYPAVRISWEEAVAFCEWLSRSTGWRARLPTEAEWEKAARGIQGRIYPWGDHWDRTRLNSNDGGEGDITPVDRHTPAGDSPFGAADIAGNVWEWTADWYNESTYVERAKVGMTVLNPLGPDNGTHRVLRGGSHFFRQSGTRAANRHKYIPRSRCYDIGFRIVAEAGFLT